MRTCAKLRVLSLFGLHESHVQREIEVIDHPVTSIFLENNASDLLGSVFSKILVIGTPRHPNFFERVFQANLAHFTCVTYTYVRVMRAYVRA